MMRYSGGKGMVLIFYCTLLSLTSLTSLESKLRSFACLTKGDVIGIEYNDKVGPWVVGVVSCL